jgi:L-ascorbate metabolism protein UlaG (beta-lactamase superfamily)
MTEDRPTIKLIGGPTALLTYGGLRILTDPTFDPPGEFPRPRSPVVLRKLTGPAVAADDLPPIDLVLVSHDHHSDNLDSAGRAFLPNARIVLTTTAGAARLGRNSTGLEPGALSARLMRPVGSDVHIIAVPAEHGSPEVAAPNGPVIGFVLRGDGLPTIYISGDNASVDVVAGIVRRYGPFDAAILFAGGARVPELWGSTLLTLDAGRAADAAALLDPAVIVPVHQEGWEHFTSPPEDLRRAFAAAGVDERLRPVEPGGQVEL